MQNYSYNNDNIVRRGLQESFKQSQIVKPNELINDNPILKRDSFDRENKVIKQLNDDIFQLNSKIQSLLMKQNDYDKLELDNKNADQKIMELTNKLEQNKNQMSILNSEIDKLKQLIYDKYNNKKYFLIRDLSKKYETDFDIVHIICNKLNIDETNINKGSINDVVAEIKSFHEKEKQIN